MKKLFILALTLSVSAWASNDSLETRVSDLQAQMDNVLSKAGIHFNGEFRGQYLNSEVSGGLVEDTLRKSESAEFTSIDFDIVARPNSALNARAIFRMHQDWRIFFSDLSSPIVTRWLSIDGEVGNGLFSYHAGDFKKKISPLTLWAPEVELVMEPEIFARRRRLAMAEEFLGDNNRVLQGIDLSFAAEIYPILKKLDLGFYGARLRTAEVEGTGHSLNGIESADYTKYLWGFNGGAQIVPGLGISGTYLNIFDNIETFKGSRRNAELGAQNNTVFSGRLKADNQSFMASDMVDFGINAEAAISSDVIPYEDTTDEVVDSTISDMALYADLFADLSLGDANSVNLSLGFLNNGADFRNDAAQSPTYIPQRIMNTANAPIPVHSFDAMYRNVFWFSPAGDGHLERHPHRKLSYTRAILEREEYADGTVTAGDKPIELDPVFQGTLPFGLATPNRTGPIVNLEGSLLNKGINVAAKVASLSDMEETEVFIDDTTTGISPKAEYMETAFGANFDITRLFGISEKPLIVGGSYSLFDQTIEESTQKSNLQSANMEWNFYKHYSLLFGYQKLHSESPEILGFQLKDTYTNLAAGLRCEVVEGGILDIALTHVTREGEGYTDVNGDPEDVDFKALQPEILLTVKF
ncbi:MAG: hypothetical protein ACLFQB_05490 [Chitinispirillaceae bacterium]